jgi:hypothetical protein
MEEFERVFPEMIEKRGTQEYMDMLEDYFRGLASKDREGIMMAKEGGRANLALGTKPTPEESGLGGLPIEADMRYTGGFMPYGAKEKADDVPARLSKNEFVFTADAVRAAGGGSVNEGVAGFQPFLTDAQTTLGGVSPMIQAAATRTGPTAFQAFESPYQAAVRDATLAQFDEQARARRQGISDTAAKLGALGAGRTGVQLAEYDRKSDMDRALLQAQLNQAGFTQANQLAAQAFKQQGQLAGLQSGLANQQLDFATTQPQLAAGAIGMAQGLGQGDLAYRQAVQDAQTSANRMAAFEPIERLARFGQGLTGVGGGLGSVQTTVGPPPPQQSPLAGALQAGIGAFSLGKLFG